MEGDWNKCCLQHETDLYFLLTLLQSTGGDDHNLSEGSQCDTWECIHSSIFFLHPSIYPQPHLVSLSVFALSLFLVYLNQLSLAPVKRTPCTGSHISPYQILDRLGLLLSL